MAMYCGDEVCAVVADMGSSSCRFGQAGQDSPRHVFRSDVGKHTVDSDDRFIVGDNALRVVRDNLEILEPQEDGVLNWDAMETLLKYGLDTCLQHVDQKDYPILIAENNVRTATQKEKLLEILFESFDLPASYFCHNATMASFASGRPTSLVVDLGASASRCVPVVDGYALHRSAVATHRGGMYFDQAFAEALQVDFNGVSSDMVGNGKKRARTGSSAGQVTINPWYECARGTICAAGDSVPTPTSSFRRMHCLDTVRDMRHWMCFVPPSKQKSPVSLGGVGGKKSSSTAVTLTTLPIMDDGYDLSGIVSSIPSYELPDGTKVQSCNDATLVIDMHLFNPNFASSSLKKTSRMVHNLLNSKPKELKALHNGEYHTFYDDEADLAGLVMQAVLKADVDARKELLGNIVVVGGGALTDGVVPRLQSDLAGILPNHIKSKVVPSLLPLERQHAAWLGGSILGICGSFQQLWISREEYQENGPAIHRQRCVH